MPGSRSNLDVYLRLHGQRKFAKEVEQSGAELEAMGLKGAKSMAAFAKSAEKLKSFGRSWTRNISLPIAGLGVVAGYAAMNFKRQMGLIATDAGGTAKEVAKLEPAVLGIARTTQYSGTEMAESLFHAESAGFRYGKALKVVHESAKLATAGNSEFEATTYALVSATKALYGGNVKYVKRTAAEINGIVAHGDMRLEELVAGFGSGLLAKAKSVGLNLRDVGAAMDVMTARGIPAQRAAYALGFTMQKLIPYGTKAEEAFASIGLGEETLIKASQHGKYGYVTGLEVLQKHLDRLPTKAAQTKVIEEMFGGGRMTSGLLTDLQNLGDMKKIYGELGDEVKLYNQHVHDAEEQPMVKMKKAWGSIQDDLIEIGGELLPEIVPAGEKFASFSQRAAAFIQKIPGPVKAIGLGALLLTGPVATGLGFFAGGIGRTLVLLAKLGRMTQNLGIFSQAMKAGQGLEGSAAIAFNGFGKSAALQTAKGLAYSLGPAVAAYGIGNIVTSATSGDWKEAGFEAGGAVAGGIAGFMLGGPMGAMLGVGIGSLGGELLSGLFKTAPQIPFWQQRLASSAKEVKAAFESEHSASEQLARSGKSLVTAHHNQRNAARELKGAEHALAVVRGSAPAGSMKVIEAEVAVAEAIEGVTEARRKAKRAERLHGEDRAIAKEGFQYATLAGRHRKNVIKQRISELREERQAISGKYGGRERLLKLRPVDEELTEQKEDLFNVSKKLNGVFGEAANQIGPKYAGWLHRAARNALELGSELAAVEEVATRVNGLLGKFTPAEGTGSGLLEALGSRPLAAPKTKHHHHGHAKNHRAQDSPLQARRLTFRQPSRLSIDTGALAVPRLPSGDLNVTVQSVLDGQVAAESTTKVAKRAALLQ